MLVSLLLIAVLAEVEILAYIALVAESNDRFDSTAITAEVILINKGRESILD
jgi:hypothetical protein